MSRTWSLFFFRLWTSALTSAAENLCFELSLRRRFTKFMLLTFNFGFKFQAFDSNKLPLKLNSTEVENPLKLFLFKSEHCSIDRPFICDSSHLFPQHKMLPCHQICLRIRSWTSASESNDEIKSIFLSTIYVMNGILLSEVTQ